MAASREVEPSEHYRSDDPRLGGEGDWSFTLDDLKRMPGRQSTRRISWNARPIPAWSGSGAQLNGCQFTHGMIHNVWYTGIPLKTLMDEAGVKTNGKWVLVPRARIPRACRRSIPIDKVMKDCLVVWGMNGEALRPEQGYPRAPRCAGLGRQHVGEMAAPPSKSATSHGTIARKRTKYTDLLADGRSRRFTWIMDAKSVITNPSPQAPMKHKGPNVLTGVAWSGRGSVSRVDVTIDGGKNWRTARLDGPVAPLSMRASISISTGTARSC